MNRHAINFYRQKRWKEFIEVLSPQQSKILAVINTEYRAIEEIRAALFVPTATVRSQLAGLSRSGVIGKTSNQFYLIHYELGLQCKQSPAPKLDRQVAEAALRRELEGLLAPQLSALAKAELAAPIAVEDVVSAAMSAINWSRAQEV